MFKIVIQYIILSIFLIYYLYTMDYKKKYLKYKKKYIEYKNQNGGICNTCPIWGFKQHFTECWNDEFSTILLYSDDLSELIQDIFNDPNFNIDNIIDKALHNPEWLIPINIENIDMDTYKYNARYYIENLKLRYDNQKSDNIIKPPRDTRLRGGRPRRDSISQSLSCTLAIFNITNINNYNPIKYHIYEHGATELHFYNIINLINYYIMNYKNVIDTTFIKTLEIISIENINLSNIFLEDKYFIYYCNDIENNLKIFLENLKTSNTISVLLSDINKLSNHAIGFFKCNNIEYFYDNEGIDGINDIEPDEIDNLHNIDSKYNNDNNDNIYISDFEEIYIPEQFYQNNNKQFIEFRWKDNLMKSIDDILMNDIPILKNINESYYRNDKINNINNKLFSFFYNYKYNGIADKLFIGKKNLKKYNISKIDLIKVNYNTTNISYNKFISKQTLNYKNDRTKKIIIDYIISNNNIIINKELIINFLEYYILNSKSINELEFIEEILFDKYLENKDINIVICDNILIIANKIYLYKLLLKIEKNDNIIIIDENFIKNLILKYFDYIKVKDIEYLYSNNKEEQVSEAILDMILFTLYTNFLFEIVLSDFFDINYKSKISGETILSKLYFDKNIDNITRFLDNDNTKKYINLYNYRYLNDAIYASKVTGNINFVKLFLNNPYFDSVKYNTIIFPNNMNSYNDYISLDYHYINNIDQEIFDLMIDKNLSFNQNDNFSLLDILFYDNKSNYYYIKKLIENDNLDINKIFLENNLIKYNNTDLLNIFYKRKELEQLKL